jgi:hypothetical protein
MLPVFCGFPTNQQKSGASVWSARAAEPAAIVATLGGRIKATGVLRTDENGATEKWRQRHLSKRGRARSYCSNFFDAGSSAQAFFSFFCSLTNREVARLFSVSAAPAGGNQADEKRAIVEIYRCRYSTHFSDEKRTKCSSVATRDPRFPPIGGRCRNCDSAFPCSKGRAIHI